MIPLTYLEYELSELPEKTLERLKWSVFEAEMSWFDRWNDGYTSPSTHKPWVGSVNEKKMKFSLQEPVHLFNKNFFVVVRGYLEQRASTTLVKLKIGVAPLALLLLTLTYTASAFELIDGWISGQIKSIIDFPLFLSTYSIYGTFQIWRRIKRAEEKLDQTFA